MHLKKPTICQFDHSLLLALTQFHPCTLFRPYSKSVIYGCIEFCPIRQPQESSIGPHYWRRRSRDFCTHPATWRRKASKLLSIFCLSIRILRFHNLSSIIPCRAYYFRSLLCARGHRPDATSQPRNPAHTRTLWHFPQTSTRIYKRRGFPRHVSSHLFVF